MMSDVYPTIEELFYHYVFPIVIFRHLEGDAYQPVKAVGTGFTLGEGDLFTCWHCLSHELAADEVFGIPFGDDMSRPDQVTVLTGIRRHPGGTDLAVAKIGIRVKPVLRVSSAPARWGSDVVGLGFPLPVNTINSETGEPLIKTQGRVLKGYVSSVAMNTTGGAKDAKYYELGMPVPRWASGSPLLSAESLEVVGVLAGEKSTAIGEDAPLVVGLAIHLDTLREVMAPRSTKQLAQRRGIAGNL